MKPIRVILLSLVTILVSLGYIYFTHIHTDEFLFFSICLGVLLSLGSLIAIIEVKRAEAKVERKESITESRLLRIWSY